MKYFRRTQHSHLGYRKSYKAGTGEYYARSVELTGELVYKMDLPFDFIVLLTVDRWEI